MKKFKVFIACDTTKPEEIRNIIKYTETNKLDVGYKFGLEFFLTIQGRNFISKLKKKSFLI